MPNVTNVSKVIVRYITGDLNGNEANLRIVLDNDIIITFISDKIDAKMTINGTSYLVTKEYFYLLPNYTPVSAIIRIYESKTDPSYEIKFN